MKLFWAGQGQFGLDEMPQGERRETVLHVVRRQGIVLSGGRGSSGSTSCRRVSAEKLFCVGKGAGGGAGYCCERANGEFRLEGLPQGQRRETVLRGGGGGRAAGYCSGRGKGEFGLEELPQGERRETVLRMGAGIWGMGRRQEIGLSGRRANSGSETCRRASAGTLFCVGEQRRGGGRTLL